MMKSVTKTDKTGIKPFHNKNARFILSHQHDSLHQKFTAITQTGIFYPKHLQDSSKLQ